MVHLSIESHFVGVHGPYELHRKEEQIKCTALAVHERIFNDKAFFFPTAEKHVGQLFNFRIFIKLFIHEVQKTSKFLVLGLYLLNKY